MGLSCHGSWVPLLTTIRLHKDSAPQVPGTSLERVLVQLSLDKVLGT